MAKKKRLRLRFSLMTLFVVTGGLCVWLGYGVEQARRQREAIAALCATGSCDVWYDFQVEGDGPQGDEEPDLPEWLLSVFGMDFFYDVEAAWVGGERAGHPASSGRKWQASSLQHLKDLNALRHLIVCYARLSKTEIVLLAQSDSLEQIDFAHVEFSGQQALAPITRMAALRKLTFHYCDSLAPEDLNTLHSMPIEELTISRIWDASPDLGAAVGGFRHLQMLEWNTIPLTDEDLAAICRLPKLRELKISNYGNRFSEANAQAIASAPALCVIEIEDDELTDEFLRILNTSASLETVNIRMGLRRSFGSAQREIEGHIRQLLPDKNVKFN